MNPNLAGHGIYAIIEDTTTPQPPRDPIFPIKFAKQAMGKIETHNHETGEITATLHTPDNQQLHVTATIVTKEAPATSRRPTPGARHWGYQ